MGGRVQLQPADSAGIARVLISHPGKLNALSVAMWHELRAIFDALNTAAAPPRVLLLHLFPPFPYPYGHQRQTSPGYIIPQPPPSRLCQSSLPHVCSRRPSLVTFLRHHGISRH